METSRLAFSTYLKEKLPLLDPNVEPSSFQQVAETVYASVINGLPLDGNKKPGPDESKIKMHIKSGLRSALAIEEAIEKTRDVPGGHGEAGESDTAGAAAKGPWISPEGFYKACEDVLLVYLDTVHSSSIRGDDHLLFTKLTQLYEARFMEDMRSLNVLDPDELTRVTEYGPEIVNFVERIVKNDFAYATSDGSVYFDIKAFEEAGNHYAKLEPWNRNDKQLQRDGEGSLTNHVAMKRSKNDFALWKSSRPGEPSWNSPWGKGRPGWHIECSAMASAKLGSQMDIHSGGIDLAFPHHDNELAQSEAYWRETQWVNYFLHIGHLSIQGSKMSKSLKNFTTIREALGRGSWNSRSLRIVFLLGGWREGIEITEDMIWASKAWEEKLNNFFLKVKNTTPAQAASLETPSTAVDDTLSQDLAAAQDRVWNALCDSFNTPSAMAAISELVTKFNSAESSSLRNNTVGLVAQWITSMVNIFGLNGTASGASSEIGWSGIDIPEYAAPILDSLSTLRDSLRELAISKTPVTPDTLSNINGAQADHGPIADAAQPYADVLADFRQRAAALVNIKSAENCSNELLTLCDQVRDVDLFDLGIYLEDQPNGRALVRPVTRDILEMRQRDTERTLQKQRAKEERERKAVQQKEKGKISPREMFKTAEFSAWDDDGVPTKDSEGKDVTKSRMKKLRKDWERQAKLHEAWVANNP